MHTIDFIILAIVAVLVVFTAIRAWKRRGQCCGNCSACGAACARRQAEPPKQQDTQP